jgi:XTP/dITP diphosphohydrolase
MQIVLASRNKGKIREINAAIGLDWIQIVTMDQAGFFEDIEEYGTTFEQNSLIKAKTVFDAVQLPCFADDSGLCVKALGGRPGIHSARYGGSDMNWHDKNICLLREMEGISDREAYFVCSVAFIFLINSDKMPCIADSDSILKNHGNDAWLFSTEATISGNIHHMMSGNMGFGFDPIFFVPELGCTIAELPVEEKNKLSHRGKAFGKVRKFLEMNKDLFLQKETV